MGRGQGVEEPGWQNWLRQVACAALRTCRAGQVGENIYICDVEEFGTRTWDMRQPSRIRSSTWSYEAFHEAFLSFHLSGHPSFHPTILNPKS